MCSLFGFVAPQNGSPDLKTLNTIIRANIQRGPHAFGFSWINRQGRLRMFKQTGRLTDHLGILAMAADARVLIGHLRYATHGDPAHNINNHPHPADSGWIAHNGVIHNHESLIEKYDLNPVTPCDSETLGQLIETLDGPRLTRCIKSVKLTTGNLAMLGLWSRPSTLIAIRRGNPLHYMRAPEGIYLSTVAEGLRGKSKAFDDNSAAIFKFNQTSYTGVKHVRFQPSTKTAAFHRASQRPRNGWTARTDSIQGDGDEYRGG